MSKWILQRKHADYATLSKKLNIDPVIIRLMINRGIQTFEEMKEYLNPSLTTITDSYLLADIDKACVLLKKAIYQNQKIRVVGDYDVDGIMSTYILTSLIKKAGGNVDYTLPHRILDGYGINPEMVRAAYNDGIELIITCDNGIAAADAIKLAKELGITFIVTDHHEVPYELFQDEMTKVQKLPNADAIVDPKRKDCKYPFKGICGAQVVWKLAYVLFEQMSLDTSEADKYLPYAAVATVCDVMELRGENRAVVYHGLKALECTNNVGLNALLSETDLKAKKLSAYHLGFILGPCLNASGRLDTAKKAVELLYETNYERALVLARELVELNIQRKNMTQTGVDEAKKLIENTGLLNDRVLVVYLPELHESLAGIVAGRIRESYNKPTLVITNSENGAKGSGRSIEQYNMFEELSAVKDIFTKFGGHPMAAGISLPVDKVDELRTRLNNNCCLTSDDMEEIVKIDCDMPLSYIRESLIEEIDKLDPFGVGNTKPVFALKDISVINARYIGKNKQYMKLNVKTETNKSLDALLFNNADRFKELIIQKYGENAFQGLFNNQVNDIKVDIIYEPSINEFRGVRNVQIIVQDFK